LLFERFTGQRVEQTADIESTLVEVQDETISIAVLPFVNMSSDPEQDYFSDGISEEILNLLVRVEGLSVASRTSAFSFKGSDENLAEIADVLGVDHILEGSVRKSNDRVRITAQLIDAQSDRHLWSETFDRELTDIFAIQDDISGAIVEALRTTLGVAIQNTGCRSYH
jgi:TolB-like protein